MMKDLKPELAVKEKKYLNTIKTLRLKSFTNNLPFLMLSESLPDGQSYLEFPDGEFIVHEVFLEGTMVGTKTVRTLRSEEGDQIRKEYELL